MKQQGPWGAGGLRDRARGGRPASGEECFYHQCCLQLPASGDRVILIIFNCFIVENIHRHKMHDLTMSKYAVREH